MPLFVLKGIINYYILLYYFLNTCTFLYYMYVTSNTDILFSVYDLRTFIKNIEMWYFSNEKAKIPIKWMKATVGH